MYSYYYTSLPRSVPLKNGYEADLEIHAATLNYGKGMLQQEIEKEVPDSSELQRLGEVLGETMKAYGKAASSIKKQVAVPLSLKVRVGGFLEVRLSGPSLGLAGFRM